MASLDMASLFDEAYHLSQKIVQSALVAEYIERKRQLYNDESAFRLIREFQEKKERFQEAERFGHYHPDYHQSRREARDVQRKMELHPTIGAFLKAERELDELLFLTIKTIAHAISPTVKIPANDPRLERTTLTKYRCG